MLPLNFRVQARGTLLQSQRGRLLGGPQLSAEIRNPSRFAILSWHLILSITGLQRLQVPAAQKHQQPLARESVRAKSLCVTCRHFAETEMCFTDIFNPKSGAATPGRGRELWKRGDTTRGRKRHGVCQTRPQHGKKR